MRRVEMKSARAVKRRRTVSNELPTNFYEHVKPRLHRRIGKEIQLAGSVVDLGCGSCDLVQYLATVYKQKVVGVDLSGGSFPRKRHTVDGMRFRCVDHDAMQLEFITDESVDAVVTMWAFHEMSRPETVLREVYRILRPGGELVVVDFPRDSLAQSLWNEDYYRPDEISGLISSTLFEKVHARLVEKNQIIWLTAHRPVVAPAV